MRNPSSLALFLVSAALLAGGCGGSSSSPRAARGRGKASITVEWPAPSRLIPLAANSLKVDLVQNGIAVGSALLVRPAGGGTTSQDFSALPFGTLTVVVTAFPNADGTGAAQATGTGLLEVGDGTFNRVTVAPESTVKTLALVPALTEVKPNETATLRVSAKNAAGDIVLLSTADGRVENVVWNTGDASVATVSDTGPVVTLSGLAIGRTSLTATLTTSDAGATVVGTGVADVLATAGAGHPESALLDGGYPTPRGGAGNAGRGSGSGTTGVVGPALAVGATSVGPKVVDKDGNLYAASGATVRSFGPGGGERWSKAVVGSVLDLALTKDGRLYVVGTDLSALSAATGELVVPFATFSAGAGRSVAVAPNGDVIYSAANGVYALRATDHTIRWFSPIATAAAPAVDSAGDVYLRLAGSVAVLSGATGETLRNIAVPNAAIAGVAVQNGVVLAAGHTTQRVGKANVFTVTLYALDAATGAQRWAGPFGANAAGISNVGFAFTSDGGAVASSYTTFRAFDASGNLRSGWPIGGGFTSLTSSGPLVGSDDTVYFLAYLFVNNALTTTLYAYGLDGSPKPWSPRQVAPVTTVGLLSLGPDGAVYVGLTNGSVVPVR